MAENKMDIFTTVDKNKRDELFEELRKRGLSNERQAVKFSGVQYVLGEDGEQIVREVRYSPTGRLQFRPVYQINYSVAYPRELSRNTVVHRRDQSNLPSNLKQEHTRDDQCQHE